MTSARVRLPSIDTAYCDSAAGLSARAAVEARAAKAAMAMRAVDLFMIRDLSVS
jgi:hypothetical protein